MAEQTVCHGLSGSRSRAATLCYDILKLIIRRRVATLVSVLRLFISNIIRLMQVDLSEKIRQRKTAYPIWRTVICLLILAALTVSPAIGITGPAYQIAVFDFDKRQTNPDPLARHIEAGLRRLLENVEVTHYSGLGDEAHSVTVLKAIEIRGYDLVITRTSDALILARHTLHITPTLYTNANNPLSLGFRTLGPPGGNISGASYHIPIERQLRVYQAIVPTLSQLGFIFDKHNKSRKAEVPETRKACDALGLAFHMEFVDSREQLPSAARTLMERGADAIVAASSGTVYDNIHTFLEETSRHGVPVFSFYKKGVPDGAVAALSSDYFRMVDELLLPMVAKVLRKNVSPGSLPAAFLEKNQLFINRTQVQRLGLAISDELQNSHEIVYID